MIPAFFSAAARPSALPSLSTEENLSMRNLLTTATLALFATLPAQATVAIVDGNPYTQNFDSLTTATSASAWVQNSTLPGWYLFISTLADAPTIAADTGGSNTGTFRSFGASGGADRALGSVASGGGYFGSPAPGAVAAYIAVGLVNNTGLPIEGFASRFDSEQWRNGGNTASQTYVMEYGFGAAIGTVAAWTAGGAAADLLSPVVGSTGAAVDGNAAGLVAGQGLNVSGLTWLPGETLWLRWTDRNDVGNDHGLAIDNFSFSASVVPEPGALGMLLAGLAAVGFVARRRG
jgi:hypothetical protein